MSRRKLLSVISGAPLLDYEFEGTSWPVGTQDNNMLGITARNEPTRVFLVGTSTDSVWRYTKATGGDATNVFGVTPTIPKGLLFDDKTNNKYWIPNNSTLDYEGYTTAGAASGSMDTSPQMSTPTGGDVDLLGNFWLSDDGTNAVYKFNTSNVYTTINFPTGGFTTQLEDLAFDDNAGTIWLLSGEASNINLIEVTTSGIATGNVIDLTLAGITAPRGVAYDPFDSDTMWVVDVGTDKVFKFKRGG